MDTASVPDALPGRIETIELWPLSQGEIERRRDRFAERVFTLPDGPLPDLPALARAELAASASTTTSPRRRTAVPP